MTDIDTRARLAAFTRRRLLKAAALASMVASTATPARAAGKKVVGFLASGPWNDFGYTQSHLDAIQELAKDPNLKIIKEEGVPETADVQKSIRSMIEIDGASLIVGTSYGYFEPHMIEMAKRYPKVQFLHCGGFWTAGMPKNLTTYFAYGDEVSYISGVVAGKMAAGKPIGYVASKPVGVVLSGINAFALGARSVDPKASVQLVLTGEWSDPVKEANATNSLIDKGAGVLAIDVDAPKVVIDTCAKRGVMCIGRHTNLSSLAPKTFLTGSEWNWLPAYQAALAGKMQGQNIRGGLAQNMVRNSPFGAAVSSDARAAAETAKAELLSGKRAVYAGPIKDNTGKLRVPAGKTVAISDPSWESVDWLVEGIIGKAS